jgi:hypothetical protein
MPNVWHAVYLHDLVGKSALAQKAGHGLRRGVDMFEERLVADAQVVESKLAIRGRDEPVARTLAVAGESDVALSAVLGQAAQLCCPNARCFCDSTSSRMGASWIFPADISGST